MGRSLRCDWRTPLPAVSEAPAAGRMAVLGRLTFLQQLPLLLKGTSDDDTPCPGYLYEEIASILYCLCPAVRWIIPIGAINFNLYPIIQRFHFSEISHESSGSCQCLLEYLLNRLQNHSCHVKLKVLKILLYLCSHGSDQIIQDLRRNAVYIQEASAVSGPPDPLHGITLYQRVRSAGQELVGSLYTDPTPRHPNMVPNKERCQPGMGSQLSRSQGFGYTKEKQNLGTPSEALLSGIQRAAVAVTQKVLVGAGSSFPCLRDQADDTYKPVAVPTGSHRSGVPGGGWDDSDSGHSSQDSFHNKSPHSQSSDAGSKTGSDGQSRSSTRESTEIPERVETAHPGDCLQEAQLVVTITRGQKVFLTQEEVQHFIRGCSLLNCEVVFAMLNRSLEGDDAVVQLRSMCAVASLMTSDLLSHDHMLAVVRKNLQKLIHGPPGPVKDKARKILLQFEALIQASTKLETIQLSTSPSTQPTPLDLLTDALLETGDEDLLTPSNTPTSPIAVDPSQPACCGYVLNGHQHTDGGEAATFEKEDCAHTVPHGQLSLFDGMELVTPVRRLGKDDMPSPKPPNTLLVQTVSQERTSQPGLSAFSFLNS
ncbi:AP-4 complex accessory subunit tepsin isoform X2 [Ranitomeya imitator]|uniref:AP-4 complex accessory subunit tepsin isoform X2 n=1 Tax=Ranitomeya imitator TaxID=111125 RepID=UPI0037E722CA